MPQSPPWMITGGQIRAARALLRWGRDDLARRSGVSETAIWRAENVDTVPTMRADNLYKIERALEDGGVIFLDGDDVGPGVRLRLRPP
jgi:transcriptional regulator with XRE-family HTH domain